MTTPLIACADARIDADGAVLLDSLTFEADGARVGLVGGFTPLLRVLERRAVLSRGSVQVLGIPAETAVATNHLGLAPAEPTLPEPWTVHEYLSASAALLGISRRQARSAATEALETLGAQSLAKRKIGTLATVERRILFLVHAIMGRPDVIVVESPLARLTEADAAEVRRVLELATHGRRLVVTVEAPASVGPEFNLLATMDRVAVMAGGAVVAVGPPAETLTPSPRCVVVVARHAPALASLLVERGLTVERSDDPTAEMARFVVLLPEGATAMTVVDAALDVDAPLLELVSVGLDPPG